MRKVVVLGNTVAKNLFPDTDPVGGQIQVRNVPFTIVGVLATKGQTASGSDQDDVVLVPYTTAQTRLSGFTLHRTDPGEHEFAERHRRRAGRDPHDHAGVASAREWR